MQMISAQPAAIMLLAVFLWNDRKRQIKGRVDRCEKIVVERIEMFHHY